MMPFDLARWTIEPVSLVVLAVMTALYLRGWRRLHRVFPALAARSRLAAFLLAVTLLLVATASPLYWWSSALLSARAAQKVLIVMLVPPLLWLSIPLHICVYGLPRSLRVPAANAIFAPHWRTNPLASLHRPMIVVMGFLALFLLWHEPAVVNVTLGSDLYHLASIWLLLGVAVLYWSYVVDTGPRKAARVSGWAAAAYLLAAEVPNMATGVTIAFTGRPLYAHYVAVRGALPPLPLSPLEDQMVAGAIIWVIGSLVYVSSIVLIINGIFRREGGDQPIPRTMWDIDENFIAPGLEHRVDEGDYARPNWGDD